MTEDFLDMQSLLEIKKLGVRFPVRGSGFFRPRFFFAVRNICLNIRKKETLCLVGESGSGKTTLAWSLLGLHPFCEGTIAYKGEQINKSNDLIHKQLVSDSQMVFQNPVSSLSPYLSLRESIEEPLKARKIEKPKRDEIIQELAEHTMLSERILKQKPLKTSGGQNQRACIARALSTRPGILFLDEPLTALDALIRKQVADLIARLKEKYSLTCFLITHDFRLVKRMGTHVAVMYLGRIVEKATKESFFSNPCHPYSQALLSSVSWQGIHKGKQIILKGEIPSPQFPPAGCVFHPRCFRRMAECSKTAPPGKIIDNGHEVFCHLC